MTAEADASITFHVVQGHHVWLRHHKVHITFGVRLQRVHAGEEARIILFALARYSLQHSQVHDGKCRIPEFGAYSHLLTYRVLALGRACCVPLVML